MQERVTTVAAADNSRNSYSVSALAPFVDAFLLLLVGFLGVSDGLRIILTKADTVGGAAAGGWIVLLGGLLIVGTYKLCVQQVRSAREGATLASDTRAQLWAPITVISMLFIYIASIDWLGYALSTLLFMAAYLRLFGKYNVFTIAVISVAFAFGSNWLWTKMEMMLPHGSLPWS